MDRAKMLFVGHKLKIVFLLSAIGVYLAVFMLCLSAGLFERKSNEFLRQPVSIKVHRVYINAPSGRLGNKLFHLAACYGIALMNNRKLVISPTFNNKIKTLLNSSCLDVEIANAPKETKIQQAWTIKHHPKMNDTNLYLRGYIQTMKYFLPYVSSIKNSMVINDNLVGSVQQFLHSLHLTAGSTYVGIHIRRGDRASPKWMNRTGQVIPGQRYLKNAMAYFLSKYTKVNFIVCTDDLSWCKRNLKNGMSNGDSEYGTHFSPGKSPEWDIALLAQCNHSIITVGTFGWWGAWFAGGETIYFKHPFRKGYHKGFIAEDYFWPTWIGMDDE